ncbi:MAG: hypothetical protein HOE90_09110 [Bacteriovoracaceae bacterium]|jgi:hypothetical protein|nr:hypothetical protein [Bacteriovoracaceae bacterium]
MKSVIAILCGIFIFNSYASSEIEGKVIDTWKSAFAPAKMRYLAHVQSKSETSYDRRDWLLLFGRKGKNVSQQALSLGGMSFYTSYEKASSKAKNLEYAVDIKVVKVNKKIRVKVVKREGNVLIGEWVYRKHNSKRSISFAKSRVAVVEKEQKRLSEIEDPATLEDFKKLLFKVEWDNGFSADEYDFDLPYYALQIEFGLNYSPRNKVFAGESIKEDGSDPLSKKFRASSKWYGSADEAEQAAVDIIEANLGISYDDDYDDEYREVGYHSSYSTKASNFKSEVLARGAKKFVKYEIVSTSGFDCEDGVFTWSDTHWVLIDGSVFSYIPGTECD